MKAINLVFAYQVISLKTLIRYRTNFAIAVLANVMHYSVSILFISVLLDRFPSLAGWTKPEVLFLYGVALMAFSLFGIFGQQFSAFSTLVVRGDLDRLLLRPVPIYAQVMLGGINYVYFSHFLFSSTLLVVSINQLGLDLNGLRWIYLAVSIAMGAMLQLAFAMFASTLSFWTADSSSVFNTLIYTSREFIWYPIDIYSSPIRFVLTYVFPAALINYVPASFLLSKNNGVSGYESLIIIPIVFALAVLFMRWALRRYTSSGS